MFTLKSTLSPSASADLDDVVRVKTVLDGLGHFRRPRYGLTPYPDQPLFDAVLSFQKTNHLKPDGIMKPGGETARHLDTVLTAAKRLRRSTRRTSARDDAATAPIPTPRRDLIQAKPMISPTRPYWRAGQGQAVSAEAHSANGRMADYLRSVATNGDLPKLYADSIRGDGRKAIAEFGDLLSKVAQTDPKRAEGLAAEVTQRLGRDAGRLLAQATAANAAPEAPIAGAGPGGPYQPKPSPRTRASKLDKVAKGLLGPTYGQVKALAEMAGTFAPGADVKDMKDGGGEIADGVKSGDPSKIAGGAAKTAGGLLGMAVPGSYSGIKRAVEVAADGIRKAADEAKLPSVSRAKNPITAADFDKLPETGAIDPARVRTMQDTIRPNFKDGRSIEQMVRDLKSGKLQPKDVEPVRIGVVDGKVFTLDHRRVVAHREAGVPVTFRKATRREIREAVSGKRTKMTTTDGGFSTHIKERSK